MLPQRFVKRGRFKLHSGEYSDKLYDVMAMLADHKYYRKISDFVRDAYWDTPGKLTLVGIATGGALIASSFLVTFAFIHDGELKGKIEEDYVLVDDVVTTESSIKEAIKIIGKEPNKIICVVDRRRKPTMEIKSIWRV